MLDTVARLSTEPQHDTAAKRARIIAELQHDGTRSDREIGRVCGVDGKTVASVRKSIGDDDAENSARHSASGREELLARAMPHIDTQSPTFLADMVKIDVIADVMKAREALGMDDDSNPMDDASVRVIEPQPETAIYWNPAGQVVIRQRAWPDEDQFVFFGTVHLQAMIARLQSMLRDADG